MHFQFLIEDMSGEILIRRVMEKITDKSPGITFDCKSFKGIGGFRSASKVKDIKTNKLLSDLGIYLKGFDKSLRNYAAALVIVLDNDTRDTDKFRKQLQDQAQLAGISIDHIFCITVEEMEAWLLGDREAILQAYPKVKENMLNDYKQDSICGTKEG